MCDLGLGGFGEYDVWALGFREFGFLGVSCVGFRTWRFSCLGGRRCGTSGSRMLLSLGAIRWGLRIFGGFWIEERWGF